jgi:hypothetical protein
MGIGLVAFGVDVAHLQAVYGSQDWTLLEGLQARWGEQMGRFDEWFPGSEPTLQQALTNILTGRIRPDELYVLYVYATEYLCDYLGVQLENEDLIRWVDDLEIPTRLTDSGPPFPFARPTDTPYIGFLTAEQVAEEYARLKDVDLSHEDSGIAEAREEFRGYLRQAAEKELGLVAFAH